MLPPAGTGHMAGSSESGTLDRLRVLVVEDDYLQSDGIASCVTDAGGEIAGTADQAEQAKAIVAANGIDVAIIDINLGGGPSFDLASYCLAKKLPFIFVTGYDCDEIPAEFRSVHCLQKPYSERDLIEALADAARSGRAG